VNGPEASFVALGIVFIVAAVVVSFDVAGLTLSKGQEFAGGPVSLQRRWALLNAAWHSSLLLAYGAVIHFGLDFLDFHLLDGLRAAFAGVLQFLQSIHVQLPIDPAYVTQVIELIRAHVRIIIGAVTLLVVWIVYDRKIIGIPRSGSPSELTGLARSLYGILVMLTRLKSRNVSRGAVTKTRTWLIDNLQAALVAVDMLALAALLKALDYLQNWWMITSIALIVFVVVFVLGSLSARFASKTPPSGVLPPRAPPAADGVAQRALPDGTSSSGITPALAPADVRPLTATWLMVTMRLLEPLLIFYFALELVAWVVFRERIHSVGFFFGALALVVGLVVKHSFGRIVSSATASPAQGSDAAGRFDDEVVQVTFITTFRPLLLIVLGTILGLACGTLALSIVAESFFPDAVDDVPSLDGLVTRLVVVCAHGVAYASALAYLFRQRLWVEREWTWISRITRPFVRACARVEAAVFRVLCGCMKGKWTLLCCILALLVAAIVPIYEQLADQAFKAAGADGGAGGARVELKSNHYHGLQIAAWLAMALAFAWMLAVLDRAGGFVGSVEAAMERQQSEGTEELSAPEANKRCAIVGVACIMLVLGLPHLAQWHDELEIAGFRTALREDTVACLELYERELSRASAEQLAAPGGAQYVKDMLMLPKIGFRRPRSCRWEDKLADAWGRDLAVRVDDVQGTSVVTIRSAGPDDAVLSDDVVMTLAVSAP
jgi:hypothetical protein